MGEDEPRYLQGVTLKSTFTGDTILTYLRLLLKQWELDVQHPKEFALGPNSAVEHAGAIHFGPTRLGLVEF